MKRKKAPRRRANMRLSTLLAKAQVVASTTAIACREMKDGDKAQSLSSSSDEDNDDHATAGRHRTTAAATATTPAPTRIRVRSHSPERASSHHHLLRAAPKTTTTNEPPPSVLSDGTYTLMETVTAAISERCRAISRCANEVEIAEVLHQGGKDLTPLGLCCAQLWLYEPSGALSSRDADQRRLSWPSSRAQALAQAVGGASHVCMELDSSGSSWVDLAALMRNVAQSHQDVASAGSGIVEEKWCIDALGMMWKSIYAIPLVAATAAAADDNDAATAVGNGYLLATEIDTTAPAALQARGRHVAATKTKQLVAVQCLYQLAAAVAARVRMFADKSLHTSLRLHEVANAARLESAEHLLAAHEQLARAASPLDVLNVLAHAATTRLRARTGWVLTPAAVPADAESPGKHGRALVTAAMVLRADAPVQTGTLVLDGRRNHLLTSLMGGGRQHRTQRSGPRPASQHICRSSVHEVSWADLEAAGLSFVEDSAGATTRSSSSGSGDGDINSSARGAAGVTLISVHVSTEADVLD